MKQTSRLLRIGFQLTLQMSLVALVAWGVPLKSQSVPKRESRLGGFDASAKLAGDLDDLSHDIGSTDNPWTTTAGASEGHKPKEGSKSTSVVSVRNPDRVDLNRSIYHKNRIELSLDGGWLPINIPFVFDVFLGDGYTKTPLNYTL